MAYPAFIVLTPACIGIRDNPVSNMVNTYSGQVCWLDFFVLGFTCRKMLQQIAKGFIHLASWQIPVTITCDEADNCIFTFFLLSYRTLGRRQAGFDGIAASCGPGGYFN